MENKLDSRQMAIAMAKILDNSKAQEVKVLKVEDVTALTDYFVIASGTSTTHAASLADEVEFQMEKQYQRKPLASEGYDTKNWVLLDYGEVILHVFVPGTRDFYDLEHLWADGEPVDLTDLITGED